MKKINLMMFFILFTSVVHASVVPSGQQEEGRLGIGYDTDSESFKGQCLRGGYQAHGQARANISFTQSLSVKELASELGFQAGGRYVYGAGNSTFSARFLKSQRSSGFSIVSVYSGDYRFKNLIVDLPSPNTEANSNIDIIKPRLTSEGLVALKMGDDSWKSTCGDEYVQQIERGAKLFYSIRIDFSTSEEKDEFEAAFSYKSSFASVSNSLRNAKRNFSKDTKVTVSAFQIGGNVRKLSEIFATENGNGEALGMVRCSFGKFEECDQVLARALHYGTVEFKKQLAELDPNLPLYEGGPAYLNYLTKDYKTAGIYSLVSKLVAADIAKKRDELEKEFNKQLDLQAKIDHLLESGTVILSRRQKAELISAKNISLKNREAVVKASQICYTNILNCVDSVNTAMSELKAIEEDVFVIEPEEFRQYCNIANSVVASRALRDSIEGMLKAAYEMEPGAFNSSSTSADEQAMDQRERCFRADRVFRRNNKFSSFSKKGIKTLEPLKEYTHVEYLDISDNEVDDLAYLKGWNKLVELVAHNNKLRAVDELASNYSLERIRVSNNRLRDIKPLMSLSKLIRVDARNNFATVNCQGFRDGTTCLSASVRTDATFVATRTLSSTPFFMSSAVKISDNRVFVVGFGALGQIYNSQANIFTPTQPFPNQSYGEQLTQLKNGNVLITGGWGNATGIMEYNPYVDIQLPIVSGRMRVPRADHQATLLMDGRVLITGGWENGSQWTGSDASYTAEIYDPKTNEISLLPKMSSPRAWHTATVLDDGMVLLTGGFSHSGSLPTAELFDPKTNTFHVVGKSMNEGRGLHSAVKLMDGRVLIVGGFTEYDVATKTAEVYDPKLKTFKKVTEEMNRSRGGLSAILLQNGKVLVTGGSEKTFTPDHPLENSEEFLSYGELYDPEENSFSELPAKMTVPRARHVMVELKRGMVLVLGGLSWDGATQSEIFTYTDFEEPSVLNN